MHRRSDPGAVLTGRQAEQRSHGWQNEDGECPAQGDECDRVRHFLLAGIRERFDGGDGGGTADAVPGGHQQAHCPAEPESACEPLRAEESGRHHGDDCDQRLRSQLAQFGQRKAKAQQHDAGAEHLPRAELQAGLERILDATECRAKNAERDRDNVRRDDIDVLVDDVAHDCNCNGNCNAGQQRTQVRPRPVHDAHVRSPASITALISGTPGR